MDHVGPGLPGPARDPLVAPPDRDRSDGNGGGGVGLRTRNSFRGREVVAVRVPVSDGIAREGIELLTREAEVHVSRPLSEAQLLARIAEYDGIMVRARPGLRRAA